MNAAQKLKAAYAEGGREAIERDPELRLLLSEHPELGALFERAERIDDELRRLPSMAMPDDLEARIRRSVKRRRRFSFQALFVAERGFDFALVAALVLMALLPPAAGVWLLDQHRAEISLIEMQPQTVRLLVSENSTKPGGMAFGGRLMQASEQPTAQLLVSGGLGRKLEGLGRTLRKATRPSKNEVPIEALVNAVSFLTPGEAPLLVSGEAGPAPWGRETRLLRVQVEANKGSFDDVHVEVAFNLERVAAYRLLASPPNVESAGPSGKLKAGETFVALFELVPKMVILDAPSELATVRVTSKDARSAVAVSESQVAFSAMPPAFRFAGAAAWFGLELQGDVAPDRRVLDRVMALASKASPPSDDARAFLALVSLAKSVTQ